MLKGVDGMAGKAEVKWIEKAEVLSERDMERILRRIAVEIV